MEDEYPIVEYCTVVETGCSCDICSVELELKWPCISLKDNAWSMRFLCWACSSKMLTDLAEQMARHKPPE